MRIPAAWMIAGAIAIGLTSCGEEDTANAPEASVSPSAGPNASPSDPKAQTFSQPLVAGKDGKGGKDGKDKKIAAKGLSTISGLTKSTDPGEQANVADQHPEVVTQLGEAYDQWWDSIQPQLVNEDVPIPTENSFKRLHRQQFGSR